MDSNVTLKSIFVSNKEELSAKLEGLSLPKDSQKVQEVVMDFLDNMFENDGQFRQTLTESEDFLLQASIRLLHAQQNIALEFAKASKGSIHHDQACHNITSKQNGNTSSMYISVGAGVGALAGGLFGTWAAVAGAITGTALVIYCSTKQPNKKSQSANDNVVSSSSLINVSLFCGIIENICESIDGVIDTYRVQVKRIANSYEQRATPSLLNTYSMLIEQIANVIKYSKDTNIDKSSNLQNAINILEESLENYDLKYDNGKIVNV